MMQSVQLLFTRRKLIGANMFGGVTLTPLKERLEKSSYAALVNMSCPDAFAVKNAAMSKLGAGYDYLGLLGILLRSKRLQSENRFFCSEFVAWAFWKAGAPLLRPELAGRITPQHLWMLPAATQTSGHPTTLLNFS
jgi:hypothetical protein